MSEKKLVPQGAFLLCDKGTIPSQIKSSSMEEASIYGETVITEADKVFMVNFQPFGPCLCLQGQPCLAQPLMWDSLADGITIGEFAPVLEDAKLPCALGGQISIVLTPSVAFAQVPKQEKSFWDKTLDFGKGLGKGLWTGAKGTATGVYDLGVWAAKHSPPYMLVNPKGYQEQLQQDVETAKALGGLAADVGTWAYRNSAVNQLTNPSDYAAVQQENAVMVGKVVEKAKAMDAEDWGNFTGQVGFEVLTEVATAGAGLVVTGMKAADRTVDVARAAEKVDDIVDAARALEQVDDLADAAKAVDKAEDVGEAARAADKAEDVAEVAGPEPLGDVVYGGDEVPADKMKGKKPDAPEYPLYDENGELTEYAKWYYERPSGYRDGVRQETWDIAASESIDGKVRDPLTGEELSPDEPWDMGHKPGYEFRKHQRSAAERGISRTQLLDEHNTPSHYRPESISTNRGHAGEAPDDVYHGF